MLDNFSKADYFKLSPNVIKAIKMVSNIPQNGINCHLSFVIVLIWHHGVLNILIIHIIRYVGIFDLCQ